MQSKKFRNEKFRVGDLVAPNWTPETYYGAGLILEIKSVGWTERGISVYWQGVGVTKECSVDLLLLEQVVD